MAALNREFRVTHRDLQIGIVIFYIVLTILGIVVHILLAFLLYTVGSILEFETAISNAFPELALSYSQSQTSLSIKCIAIAVFWLLMDVIHISVLSLPMFAERKNNSRLLFLFRIFLYCLLAVAMLTEIMGTVLVVGPRGIRWAVVVILFRALFTCALIFFTNRRYEELAEDSQSLTNGQGAEECEKFKTQAV